ncbi:MAG: 50S ribosomal protein L23 [Deltaproteobacteria bacterium HGW-Deltaproteobacteria-11]|jgi:large subunit ribosomal protein L23|nr:MAG: 50S ribosomal protein L23 [Deltaproteobacteria bacterium HGW-Deltaproteobacteria-11]
MQFSEDIIIKPLMTEKCMNLQDSLRKYSFRVAEGANKIQIRKAIEELFKVSVESVNIQRYMGKTVTRRVRRSRVIGRKPNWKKAIVTLKEGFDIDFFKDVM